MYSRFNTETNDISTMNSNNRTAATLYSLGDIVCLRNISINTLHKGDDDDDDDDNIQRQTVQSLTSITHPFFTLFSVSPGSDRRSHNSLSCWL